MNKSSGEQGGMRKARGTVAPVQAGHGAVCNAITHCLSLAAFAVAVACMPNAASAQFYTDEWLFGRTPEMVKRLRVATPGNFITGQVVDQEQSVVLEGDVPVKAFFATLSGCDIVQQKLECKNAAPSNARLAIFFLVGPDDVAVPRSISLRRPQGPPGATLWDFDEVDVVEANGRDRTLNARRIAWHILKSPQDPRLMRPALVLCLAAPNICARQDATPTNLADRKFLRGPQNPSGTASQSVPPPAGNPPTGQLPMVLPGQDLQTFQRPAPSTAQNPNATIAQGGAPGSGTPPPPARSGSGIQSQSLPQSPGAVTPAPTQPVAPPSGPRPPANVGGAAAAPPPAAARPAAVPTNASIDIALTINGAPENYTSQHIRRLLAVVTTGVTRASDVGPIRIDESGHPRMGKLTVKGPAISTIKIAGKGPDCTAGCQLALDLREWIAYLDPLPDDAVSRVRVFPFPQFDPPEGLAAFFRERNVFDVSLPFRKRGDQHRPHVQFYLFDQTLVQVDIGRNIKTDIVAPAPAGREMALRPPSSAAPRWSLVSQPSTSTPAPAGSTATVTAPTPAPVPTPVSRPVMYVVLEPKPVPNWPADVLVKRLKAILDSSGFRAVVQAGGETVPNRQTQSEIAGSRLIVWSGDNQEVPTSFELENLPSFLSKGPVSAPSPNGVTEGRIQANQLVARSQITIPPMHLADRWQVSIEGFNRIYGREQPSPANENCELNLRARTAGSVNQIDRLVREGATFRSSTSIDVVSQLPQGAQLELEVKPLSGSGRCVQQVIPLSAPLSWKWENNAPVAGARVSMTPRGRWLLGLYAPQGIGAGLTGASPRSVFEARNQILDSTTQYLDGWRNRFFPDRDPVLAALGFDLALVSGADAQSIEPFEESSVITGQYRQSKTLAFRIDRTGEQRLDAFLSGPRGSGSAPSFEALEQAITRYSKLFGPLANERLPIVFYVGAGAPNPDSCKDWARMTANVPARVFALAFASSSASMIGQELGPNSQASAETSGQRPLGYSCKGDKESLLLFTPFPDLVARAPDVVLEGLFRRMDALIASWN